MLHFPISFWGGGQDFYFPSTFALFEASLQIAPISIISSYKTWQHLILRPGGQWRREWEKILPLQLFHLSSSDMLFLILTRTSLFSFLCLFFLPFPMPACSTFSPTTLSFPKIKVVGWGGGGGSGGGGRWWRWVVGVGGWEKEKAQHLSGKNRNRDSVLLSSSS